VIRSTGSPELVPNSRSRPAPVDRPTPSLPFSSSLGLSVPANPSSGARATASGRGLGGASAIAEGFTGLPLRPSTARRRLQVPPPTSPQVPIHLSPTSLVAAGRRTAPLPPLPPRAVVPPLYQSISMPLSSQATGTPSRCLVCYLSHLHSVLPAGALIF